MSWFNNLTYNEFWFLVTLLVIGFIYYLMKPSRDYYLLKVRKLENKYCQVVTKE
jgi:hypothetical protein